MTLNRRIKTKRKEGQNKVFEGTLKVFKGTKREERRKRDEFSLLLRKTADQIPWVFIFFAFWLFLSFFLRLWWSVVSIFFSLAQVVTRFFFFSFFLRFFVVMVIFVFVVLWLFFVFRFRLRWSVVNYIFLSSFGTGGKFCPIILLL